MFHLHDRDRGYDASTTGNEEKEEEGKEERYDPADLYQQQYMIQHMNQGYPNGHNMAAAGNGYSIVSVVPLRQQGGAQVRCMARA
jgi:hypothetical protein